MIKQMWTALELLPRFFFFKKKKAVCFDLCLSSIHLINYVCIKLMLILSKWSIEKISHIPDSQQ